MALRMNVAKLHFSAPLHLSMGKPNYEETRKTLHSDTLKSALFASLIRLYGVAFLEDYDGATNEEKAKSFFHSFDLTSAFPFADEKYFFPMPQKIDSAQWDTGNGNGDEDFDLIAKNKRLKKFTYLEQPVFERMLNGRLCKVEATQLTKDGRYVLAQEDETFTVPFRTYQQASVNISRRDEPQEEGKENLIKDPLPFNLERLVFRIKAGLFFLFQCKEDRTEAYLKAALTLLGEEGVGVRRSTGNGFFTPSYDTIGLDLPERGDLWLNLGLYCPNQEEITTVIHQRSAFNLMKRGGWIAAPVNVDHLSIRKRSVYMFEEAGAFIFEGETASHCSKGKVVNLKPQFDGLDHPIWRDGRALFLPMKIYSNKKPN